MPSAPFYLAGALADRYGGKGVLAAGVAAWSLTTCLTPPAAYIGLPALIGMRCVGVHDLLPLPLLARLSGLRHAGGCL